MGTIEERVSKLERELDLWEGKLDELVAQTEAVAGQAKLDARAHLEQAKSKLAVVRSKFRVAKAAGGEQWDKFKAGIEGTWKELDDAFQGMTR